MLINLTPHDVQIWDGDRCMASIPPTFPPARCSEIAYESDSLSWLSGQSISTVDLSYADVRDLPPANGADKYIVSVLVAQQFPERSDLLVPYDLVRNEKGSIIGCRKLARIVPKDYNKDDEYLYRVVHQDGSPRTTGSYMGNQHVYKTAGTAKGVCKQQGKYKPLKVQRTKTKWEDFS